MEIHKEKVNSMFKSSQKRGLTLNDVKIKGFGNSSIELLDNNILIRSFQSNSNISKSINDIDFLIYSRGNFLLEDKIFMGIAGQQFEISTKDDEFGLKNFFDNLVKSKGGVYSGDNVLDDNLNAVKTNQTYLNDSSSAEENGVILDNAQRNLTAQEESAEEDADSESINVAEEIRNFYNLMKEGIITEEEFEEKKKELLKL